LHPPEEESRSIETRAVDCLGALAVGLSDAMKLAMRRSTDATEATVESLLWIHRFPELRIEDLRTLLGMSHSTALRLVSDLVADGLVVREGHRKDGRAVTLRTTESGARRVLRIMSARARVARLLIDRLPRPWVVRLVLIVERLLGGLASDRLSGARACRLCHWASCRNDATAPCPILLATTTHVCPNGPPTETGEGFRYQQLHTADGADPLLELWLEPAGAAFLLPAHRRLEVVCRGEQHGHLEVERLPEGHTALYAWPGATFTVIDAGREIYVEERHLSLRTLPGRTTRESVEALQGEFAQRRREPGTRWR